MREHGTRLKVRKLYILGAGASFNASQTGQYGSPIDRDFLKSVHELDLQHPLWIEEFKGYLSRSYKGTGSFWDTGLEQAVINQLSQLDFLSTFHPKRARDNVDPTEWLDKLNALVCARLIRARPSGAGLYSSLAQSVLSNQKKGQPKDRIITFNYDTLLDKQLALKVSNQDLYFDKILDSQTSRHSERENPFPILLKIHGSSNWRCSTSDMHQSIESNPSDQAHFIDNVWVDNSRPVPASDNRPLMVPPLPNKPITGVSILQYLWRKAYEYLNEAQEICIAGYSLPQTDHLAKAMFSSFVNEHITKVHIADPDGSMINKWRDVFSRKGIKIEQWQYSSTFAEMIKNECEE